MPKTNWTQERTDRLVEKIFDSKIIHGFTLSNRKCDYYRIEGKMINRNTFSPATYIRHAMTLVESEWFRERYRIDIHQMDNLHWHIVVFYKVGRGIKVQSISDIPELAICEALEKVVEV